MGNDHIYTQIQNTRNGRQFKATYIIQYKNMEIYNLRYTPYYSEVLLLMKELTFGRARVAQWLRQLDYLATHTSLSPILRGFAPGFVNCKKRCTRHAAASDKAYQLIAHGRWFSPCIPASSTTKTGRHDIDEIMLKVALNTKNQIKINSYIVNLFSSKKGMTYLSLDVK